MRLPDFIIAGAPRSGTTWLYELLDRHPDISMARPAQPEPKFFLLDSFYRRGIDYYSRTWFHGISSGKTAGEKSTNYLESPVACKRIKKSIPHVKLIFILREPGDRAYSNYRWSLMNGMESETFSKALSLEPEREQTTPRSLRYARPHAYFSRGLYADMLKPYFEHFSRRQMLFLKFEDIKTDPSRLARRVYHFLNVSPPKEDVKQLGIVNPSIKTDPMPDHIRHMLSLRYSGPNRRLATLLGQEFEPWIHL